MYRVVTRTIEYAPIATSAGKPMIQIRAHQRRRSSRVATANAEPEQQTGPAPATRRTGDTSVENVISCLDGFHFGFNPEYQRAGSNHTGFVPRASGVTATPERIESAAGVDAPCGITLSDGDSTWLTFQM